VFLKKINNEKTGVEHTISLKTEQAIAITKQVVKVLN